jgi:cell wall assembly regulator SMI1
MATAGALARALREAAGRDWVAVTMQWINSAARVSASARTDSGARIPLSVMELNYPLIERLDSEVRADGDERPMAGELTLHVSGDFELGYSFDISSISPACLTLDPGYRYPGHRFSRTSSNPVVHDPCPPTDPVVLATITGLVDEFVRLYTEIKGVVPPLGPGYSEDEIAATEAVLGVRLPEDLRALYRNVHDDIAECGLLGRCSPFPLDFLPGFQRGEGWGSLGWTGEVFYYGREHGNEPKVVYEAFPHGTVQRIPRSERWITFGADFGNTGYAVDLVPAAGGRAGQVIMHGKDYSGPVRLAAASVTEMLVEVVDAVRHLHERADHGADVDVYLDVEALLSSLDDSDYDSYSEVVDVGDQEMAAVVANFPDPQLIQKLHLNNGREIDLADLAPMGNLRQLSANRAGVVWSRLPGRVPLESLVLDADEPVVAMLGEHPTLWNLTVKGARTPIEIGPLARLPVLERLDLSAVDVVDVELLAGFPSLRVLVLNAAQWRTLRNAGQPPRALAAAECTSQRSLADAVDWVRWLTGRPMSELPGPHRLIGAID